MLITNDEQRLQAGLLSMDDLCKCCGKAFAPYPLILSDDTERTFYHAACAVEVATEILVDLSTSFSPPAPYHQLYVLTAPEAASPHDATWR